MDKKTACSMFPIVNEKALICVIFDSSWDLYFLTTWHFLDPILSPPPPPYRLTKCNKLKQNMREDFCISYFIFVIPTQKLRCKVLGLLRNTLVWWVYAVFGAKLWTISIFISTCRHYSHWNKVHSPISWVKRLSHHILFTSFTCSPILQIFNSKENKEIQMTIRTKTQ